MLNLDEHSNVIKKKDVYFGLGSIKVLGRFYEKLRIVFL